MANNLNSDHDGLVELPQGSAKRRVGFIDHGFHQSTRSSEFFLEFLRSHFDVVIFWDDSYRDGGSPSPEEINKGQFSLIIFFQLFYPPSFLGQLNCQNLVFVPMFDSGGDKYGEFWLPLRRYAFISFSLATHQNLKAMGIQSFYLQYYPNPAQFPFSPPTNDLSLFFWYRTDRISWNFVKNALSTWPVKSVWIHSAPDPGSPGLDLSASDVERYGITQSGWFDRREDLQQVILRHSLYFAPRPLEGIGMSFLEAMAMGRVVIGVNRPTLSEYIIHGRDGFLVSHKKPRLPLAPLDLSRMGLAARAKVETGHLEYQKRLVTMAIFLAELGNKRVATRITLTYLIVRLWTGFRKKVRNAKRKLYLRNSTQ